MWNDLKEHIGTVIFLLGTMTGIIGLLLRVLWGWIREGFKAFPLWKAEMDRDGGVVTHKQLQARAIGMTESDHEIICGKVTVMVLARVEQSEKHQKEMIQLFGEKFEALIQGQDKMVSRLAETFDSLTNQLHHMAKDK